MILSRLLRPFRRPDLEERLVRELLKRLEVESRLPDVVLKDLKPTRLAVVGVNVRTERDFVHGRIERAATIELREVYRP